MTPKWMSDLTADIRTGTIFDDQDAPELAGLKCTWEEITEDNRRELISKFLCVRECARAILEIGVSRNGMGSFTRCFLRHKKRETIYVGIYLDDKSFLNDAENNIHTIRNNSSNYAENLAIIQSLGVRQLDFILIDGWHSINQCYDDWEYTRLLSDEGIVAFHDTSWHPGSSRFIRALDKKKFLVEENVCPNDWGLGFVSKR